MKHQESKGFTLVELSIVLIIVGLLVGGVLKGAELVGAARIKRITSDFKAVESVSYIFQDSYAGLPGDIRNALGFIPGCTAANFCANGDGNGRVASDGSDQYVWTSVVIGANAQAPESIQFWKHLALLDMLAGVTTSANPATPAYGKTHLASPLGGGFEYYYDAAMTLFPGGGHIMRLSSDRSLSGGPVEGALTPMEAFRIDKSIDDGEPNTGKIFANYGNTSDDCKTALVTGGSSYNVTTITTKSCVLYFKIF